MTRRRAARRSFLAGVLLAVVGTGSAAAQERSAPKLSKPPAGGDYRSPLGQRTETQDLQDSAKRLYDRAYRLREGADALRDRNRYEEADAYDDEARDLEEQARGYERRAEESRVAPPSRRPPPIEE